MKEYSSNDFNTTGDLWFYSKDDTTNFDVNKLILMLILQTLILLSC